MAQKELEERKEEENLHSSRVSEWDLEVEKIRQKQGFEQTNLDRIRGDIQKFTEELKEIEEGMEADVFMSAATKQMDALTEEGMIEEDSVTDLLENKIVLITSADSQLELSSFEDITKADTIAIGDPASVPVGQYSEEALTNLGLWDQVLAKASLGTNVTEVLNWVAEGSAQAGIVYATDAASNKDVKVLAEAPADALKTPVIYPVAALKESKNKDAADKFVKFLQSEKALKVFRSYGFTINK